MSTKSERVEPVLDAVQKAGGISLALIKELNSKERSKVSFSVWAFLFTIIYYIYHGMWKKGVVLLAVSAVLQIISLFTVALIFPAFANVSWIIPAVIFATRAPVNLYSKYRLDDDSWNPLK